MNTGVGNWANTCLACQKSKVMRHNTSPIGTFPPTARLDHVRNDIVGLLPESKNCKYIITMIDRATRWPEAVPVSQLCAVEVANVFLTTWIARFGCPSLITSAQGRQFESNLLTALTNLLGIKKIRTTSYHPQSNGLIEQWHRILKDKTQETGRKKKAVYLEYLWSRQGKLHLQKHSQMTYKNICLNCALLKPNTIPLINLSFTQR